MTTPLGTYSFLPWLRRGLANQITVADFDPAVVLRASVHVELQLSGTGVGGNGASVTETVSRDVALYAPGDIIGIDSRSIVRVEPRNWVTNFEPNYLAHIEFYDEDFPWRYTPAAPDTTLGRLRPWIALVVLAESEFTDGVDIQNKPLPYIEVADPGVFPPADQLWAWAHVHVNRSLDDTTFVSSNMGAVLPKLQAVLDQDPDLGYSRLVSPRKFAPSTAYHAFVVPVFETGRLAGLGLNPADSPNATFSSWAAYPSGTRAEPQRFPYYFRWYFRTGVTGDFESLVRLLKPKPVDKRVGTRDIDVQRPGSNVPGITNPELKGVLKLGGALRVPREDYSTAELAEVDKYEQWATPYPHPFQESLAALIDLADDYAEQSAEDSNAALDEGAAAHPDPVLTPPLYGTWHALTKRLLRNRDGTPLSPDDNWVHELNLDPRHRVAAGFGTRVVQDQQEKFMDSAWEQVGQVLEANRRIRLGQLAKAVADIWHERHLRPLHAVNRERAMMLTAPVHTRVLGDGVTIRQRFRESLVRPTLMSAAIRRVLRPRARLMRAMTFGKGVRADNLLARVNDRMVSAAPVRQTPSGGATVSHLADGILQRGLPAPGPRRKAVIRSVDALREQSPTPTSVDSMPRSPDFVLSSPGSGITPHRGETDSVEAKRFKQALKDSHALLQASRAAGAVEPLKPIDLVATAESVMLGLDPARTVRKRVWQGLSIPARILAEIGEQFVEAMAYPVFDLPMYKPLTNLSKEMFLPNINLIAQNSITLLETNQKFIESYMVGLNHEFARELLWREFPTDQRGSYFRQFWDVKGYFAPGTANDEAAKEKLRDIPPLDKWSKYSALGDHDQRELLGDKEEEVVLVIRGELLKRYPTAIIYAHRAKWTPKEGGGIDLTKERQLEPLTEAEEADPPRSKVRTPLYQAKVDPDIYFFGFDLTVDVAKGGSGVPPDDDPGWFFIIKERPGEPRFGLDINKQPDLNVWNDLAWANVQSGPAGGYIEITNATPTFTLIAPTGPDEVNEKGEQYDDDKNVPWNKDMSAAELAYILFQVPVMVAVHATEMLTKK